MRSLKTAPVVAQQAPITSLTPRDRWLIENAKRRAAAQGRPVYTGF